MPSATSTDPATARRSPRERLLEAAGELFYAEGIQSVGIDRVIERAGVAKASLYSTFGSKEELVEAYLDERHARIHRTAAGRGRRGRPRRPGGADPRRVRCAGRDLPRSGLSRLRIHGGSR